MSKALSRRTLLRLAAAAAGGTAATFGSAAVPGGLIMSANAATMTALRTSCTNEITQSTGNVYWSSNEAIEKPSTPSQTYRASLWRASKHQVNDARPLWSQPSATTLSFSRPTWAKVGSTWWGFVAVDLGTRWEIWRFDLADPEVRPSVVARSTQRIDPSLIEADPTHVYWVEPDGVHRASVYGGTAQYFYAGTMNALQLDQTYLYHVLDRRHIVRVPKAGGAAALLHSTSGSPDITSLKVHNGWMVWADAAGAVRKRLAVGGGASAQVLQTDSDTDVKVDFDGTNTVFTRQYLHWTGPRMYQICSHATGRPNIVTRLSTPAGAVLSDSTGFNWVEAGTLWRLTY